MTTMYENLPSMKYEIGHGWPSGYILVHSAIELFRLVMGTIDHDDPICQ